MTRNELMAIITAHFECGMRLTDEDDDRQLRNDYIEDLVAEAQELLAENDTPVYTEIPRTMPNYGKVSTADYYVNIIWKIERLGWLDEALSSDWSSRWSSFCEIVCYSNLLNAQIDRFEECEIDGNSNWNQHYYYNDGMGLEIESCGRIVDWTNYKVHFIADANGDAKPVIYIQREVNSLGEVVMTYVDAPEDAYYWHDGTVEPTLENLGLALGCTVKVEGGRGCSYYMVADYGDRRVRLADLQGSLDDTENYNEAVVALTRIALGSELLDGKRYLVKHGYCHGYEYGLINTWY